MITSERGFYVTGGKLQHDAPSYVARRADRDLFDALTRGEFCYVLTSRQMGKSSLMARTAARLRQEGVAVVLLDLTSVGQNLNAEQWYDGPLSHVGWQLDLADELDDYWLGHERLGPLQRWMGAIRHVVLPRIGAQCPVPGAQRGEGGAQCPVPGARLDPSGGASTVPGLGPTEAEHRAPSTEHRAPGTPASSSSSTRSTRRAACRSPRMSSSPPSGSATTAVIARTVPLAREEWEPPPALNVKADA